MTFTDGILIGFLAGGAFVGVLFAAFWRALTLPPEATDRRHNDHAEEIERLPKKGRTMWSGREDREGE